MPRLCVGCGLESDDLRIDLCSYCRVNLPWLEIRCYQCASHIEKPAESIICDKCQSSLPPFARTCAIFDYKPPIIKLINALKFGQQLYPGKLFGQLMAEAVQQRWYVNKPLPQLIIPVPLHIARQRRRGYNQSAEISRPLAKALFLPQSINVCIRNRHTSAQAKLSRDKRKRNLVDAFSVNIDSQYKHVALVDDVVTTGSTVRAASMALVKAGVECVDVWCVSRA